MASARRDSKFLPSRSRNNVSSGLWGHTFTAKKWHGTCAFAGLPRAFERYDRQVSVATQLEPQSADEYLVHEDP